MHLAHVAASDLRLAALLRSAYIRCRYKFKGFNKMQDHPIHIPVHDTLAIEAEARRLRAEFFADCFAALGQRITAMLDASAGRKAQG